MSESKPEDVTTRDDRVETMTERQYLACPITPSLGDGFFDVVEAAKFPKTLLRFRNQRAAERVGLGHLDNEQWLDHFARFQPLPGNLETPLALRYHGYQFRTYNPQLGDGRGFLFAQLRDPSDQRILDLGTKGSGRTPWSRGGDGRLTLKGGVREVLATEMLTALGVRTSQSFSLVETGESLERGDEPSPTRSSVLVRLSHSHVRFGSFERHAHHQDSARLEKLLRFSIEHYYPELHRSHATASLVDLATAWLRAVSQRTVEMCAQWMAAGFVHGVLNTDNMNITGESFDYGPYRFMPAYDPSFTAAYFDHSGLYAFARQPDAVLWNLDRLVDALSLIASKPKLDRALFDIKTRFFRALHLSVLRRLGVRPKDAASDAFLASRTFCVLEQTKVPFEQFFFDWYGGLESESRAMKNPAHEAYTTPVFRAFREMLAQYDAARDAALTDPYFTRTTPCTLVIDEIERVWAAIDKDDNWRPFEEKIAEIRSIPPMPTFTNTL
ncbi:MAG: YdiU family protein [Polyangiaceae bacterium]